MKRRWAAAVLLLGAVARTQSPPESDPLVPPLRQARYIMGTVCEVTLYPRPGEAAGAEAALNAAFEELKRIDALLSNWKEDSGLMRLNRAAAAPGEPRPKVRVGAELYARLEKALAIARETEGGFDPTVGPLVRAWGFLPSGSQPEGRARAVEEARRRVGWQKVRLDATEHSVEFAVPGMEIDLGGIAKGYAAERAAEVLREHGVGRALVNLGESSLVAVGSPPARAGWRVQIRDPRDSGRSVAWVELRDGESLASSGTYEKTTGEGAARRSHIINPRTGQALGGRTGLTLVMRDGEAADALTKPFFFSGGLRSPESLKLLERHPEASVILVAVRGGRLFTEVAGRQPGRFRLLRRAHGNQQHDAEAH